MKLFDEAFVFRNGNKGIVLKFGKFVRVLADGEGLERHRWQGQWMRSREGEAKDQVWKVGTKNCDGQ